MNNSRASWVEAAQLHADMRCGVCIVINKECIVADKAGRCFNCTAESRCFFTRANNKTGPKEKFSWEELTGITPIIFPDFEEALPENLGNQENPGSEENPVNLENQEHLKNPEHPTNSDDSLTRASSNLPEIDPLITGPNPYVWNWLPSTLSASAAKTPTPMPKPTVYHWVEGPEEIKKKKGRQGRLSESSASSAAHMRSIRSCWVCRTKKIKVSFTKSLFFSNLQLPVR